MSIPKKVVPKIKRTEIIPKTDSDSTYSSFDVVRLLKIKRITLQDWLVRGFVVPEIEAHGHGTKNVFYKRDLYQIKLFSYLIGHGLSREEASRRTKEFRKKCPQGGLGSEKPKFLIFKRKGNRYSADFLAGNDGKSEQIMMEIDPDIDEIQVLSIGNILEEVDKVA